jgi:hypothetical protein
LGRENMLTRFPSVSRSTIDRFPPWLDRGAEDPVDSEPVLSENGPVTAAGAPGCRLILRVLGEAAFGEADRDRAGYEWQMGQPVACGFGCLVSWVPPVWAWARWGRNRVRTVTNARSFDTTLSAKGTGAEGYPNPARAHIANTASIRAKEMKVALDSLTIGDKVSSDSVVISIRNSGAKNRARYRAGSGGIGGYVLAITMRSKGSSNTIGPAIAPMTPLANVIQPPGPLTAMMKKVTPAAMNVMGKM